MSEQSVSKYDLMKLTSIIPCTPEDFSDLRALHKMAINASGWRFYSIDEVAAKLVEIDEPEYTITLLNETVLLAKINEFLVGASSWRPSDKHPQTAIISALYLHPVFAKGGIATALIQSSEQAAYNDGFRWISALSDLNSRPFFTNLGYESKGFSQRRAGHDVHYPLQILTRHISNQYCQPASHEENFKVPLPD